MPESRSRSRKRKAAAARRESGQEAEGIVQTQNSAEVSREERYVPRFGPSSASKRARTSTVAALSCSQPAALQPSVTRQRIRRASENTATSNATSESVRVSQTDQNSTEDDKVNTQLQPPRP